MRISPRAALAVTAGALVLSFTGVSTASAAPGVVIQENGSNFNQVRDPQGGQCYPGLGADTAIANRTGGTILLFPDGNCQTKILNPLGPGEFRPDENVGSFLALD
ncbi:hypothetical protein [Kitasatospora sp. CB02891]|uniref:hypothetical protein n=1 Tax=Kitasatospora sp. CB02891 TaxID=2020329 RepID=UPI000C27FDE1|nr:hypothetical protein [Kitasatospora sp. CB02891]PJN26121.1 hypothetical protein CG736_12105 [Kitasatospora sp. CB02891]